MKVSYKSASDVILLAKSLVEKGAYKCVTCGKPLPPELTFIFNTVEEMWAYVECPYCHYQNALWKIVRRYQS